MINCIQEMKIFLSYARKDEVKVEQLYKQLFNYGFTPWMDKKNILGGENWKKVLTQAITDATFFLACLTKNSVNKRGVIQEEIKQALEIWRQKLEDDIYLIPVRLEDCNIPEILSNFQWVDLFKDDGFDCLVRAINSGMKRYGIIRISENKSIKSLPYLLETYDDFIESLLQNFTHNTSIDKTQLIQSILESIRKTFKAEIVYYVENGSNEIVYECQSQQFPQNIRARDIHIKLMILYPQVLDLVTPHTLNYQIEGVIAKSNICIIIPMKNQLRYSFIVIYGIPENFNHLHDVTGIIIKKLYEVTEGFKTVKSQHLIKSAIYDELKSIYKFVSNKMYEERFNIFCESLKNIQMYFEPIVYLSKYPNTINIKGWEALARDKNSKKTPHHLFKVAEMWGTRFQTELDLYCLRKALESYRPQIRRSEDVKPLHVNVYPNTLIRTVYRNELKKLIEEELLDEDEKLVLEISEKTWIPIADTDSGEEHHLKYLHSIMVDLSNLFGVKFAIDDFGIGFSSISRLHKLRPSFVKVDRDIFHHEHGLGKEAIRYLMNIRDKPALKAIQIIAEGLDSKSQTNITLSELVNKLNVKLAQGYLLGIAKPQIETRLEREKKIEIANLVKSE